MTASEQDSQGFYVNITDIVMTPDCGTLSLAAPFLQDPILRHRGRNLRLIAIPVKPEIAGNSEEDPPTARRRLQNNPPHVAAVA